MNKNNTMRQALTYKTSFAKDSYSIFKEDSQIGKLYKREWLGSPIEASVNGHHFTFVVKGFFKPVITICNKRDKQKIGTVIIRSFFKISPSAILYGTDHQQFIWTIKGILHYNWKWKDALNDEIIISSKEASGIFSRKGTIQVKQQSNQEELLVVLGIHLRNILRRQSLTKIMLSFLIFAYFLVQVFS